MKWLASQTAPKAKHFRPGLLGLLGAAILLWVGIALGDKHVAAGTPDPETARVSTGELIVRTAYEGRVHSRNVVTIASSFQGAATIVELREEGAEVEAGDLLVRFDTADSERQLLKYRTDVTLNTAELDKIRNGQQPMEILKLENEIADVRRSLAAEERYLSDSRELAADNLLSPAEIAEQEGKVETLRRKLEYLDANLERTRTYLHPMATKRAQATLSAAREELARAQRQLDNGTIFAPSAGVIAYQPQHVAGEYRTVRVGDSVFANQPFLLILDFSDLVVKISVPESELAAVELGHPALIQPTAYPDVRLAGEVEQVSGVAQPLPDKPSWQRFFRATIGVRDSHPLLRPGMSVAAQVVNYQVSDALLVPRRAVRFDDGIATVVVVGGPRAGRRQVVLGEAAETHFEVLGGAFEGERVLLQ